MRLRTVAILVPTALLAASLAWAQFRAGDTSLEAQRARPESYDGKFHYCRAVYRPNPRGDGGSWLTDYPLAEIDLSTSRATTRSFTPCSISKRCRRFLASGRGSAPGPRQSEERTARRDGYRVAVNVLLYAMTH